MLLLMTYVRPISIKLALSDLFKDALLLCFEKSYYSFLKMTTIESIEPNAFTAGKY